MKLVKLCIASVLAISLNLTAQAQEFQKNSDVLNFGIGFGSALYGSGFNMTLPPISVSYEKGIVDGLIDGNGSIGVGGYAGIAGSKYSYHGFYHDYTTRYTYFVLGARGAFHYHFLNNLDAYAGLMLGFNVVSSTVSGNTPVNYSASDGGFTGSFFVGGRYYFNPQWAAMLEFGYGVSFVNIGVAYRF